MVRLENIHKTYDTGGSRVLALRDVSLQLEPGEFASVMGPSGCGKSTLLHLLAGLDQPDSGGVFINGNNLARMDDNALTRLRRDQIGFVFQFFNLLPTLTVLENVMLPLMLQGGPPAENREKSALWLDRVGLSHRLAHRTHQLSGGEMQRAAIARALVHNPVLILADEPTGNLDSETGGQIMNLLQSISRDSRTTMLLVTHSDQVAAFSHRLIRLADGRLLSDDKK
ncbi:MAG: ABC transporter ATP-binding protein [Verrucomicrobiae bacterium]|nr:ABC transporter ATP-binding protein [Verrucomicrobiae bacterium]